MHVTTGCSRFNHPELELEVGNLPEPLVAFLVRFIEDRVAKGVRFQAGQHLQIGSGVLRVAEAGDRLTLLERAPGSEDAWERSVVRTLLAMYRQRCTLESVGMLEQVSYPAPGSFAIACTRVDEADAVVFLRQPSDDGSGWAVLCGEDDHDHDDADQLLATTVDTLCHRVELFEIFMAMPPGSLVVRDGGRIVALDFKREPLQLLDGSFLAKLREQHDWPI